MKKISLFIMSIFAVGVSLAQTVGDFSAVMPITDNNMSVVSPAGTFTAYAGGLLQAYVAGVPVSESSPIQPNGSGGVAVIGTDNLCGCDLADGGETIEFAILMNGQVIVITTVDPPVLYAANGFTDIGSATFGFTVDGDAVVFGCTDADYLEFAASANVDDASCIVSVIEGCMDDEAFNYNSSANTDTDDVCAYEGCTDANMDNYDSNASIDDGSCTRLGCMFDTYDSYDALANVNAPCIGLLGCTDAAYYEYSSDNEVDDGSCVSLIVEGCDDATAFNFNPLATENDGSCIDVLVGCTNPAADNYVPIANTNDAESCVYSGINPWGAGGGSLEAPTYITANSMSVLMQAGSSSNLANFTDLVAGDVLFAVYETARLDVESIVGFSFSEVSGISSAGAGVWTGGQFGIPVFGAGNVYDDGFEESEELTWLVKKADDGIVYNVQIENAQGDAITIVYENEEFAIVNRLSVGAPYYDGCMDATAPNFKPLATNDDGSCEDSYSIGCMDEASVNFAGANANPTHDNATNFGAPFSENNTIDLNTLALSLSGLAANIHDQSYCQDQVEGCTDAMAINYDPQATQNDNTICDWSLNGMELYNVDADGNVLDIDYNFGAVDSENIDNGILGSDFGNANILFDAGALVVEAHVISNLADVMEWIDADEIADAIELGDTITDMQARYDANETAWEVMFAADEAADAQELADTISDMQARYDSNESAWVAYTAETLAASDALLAETIAASDALLAETIATSDALLALTIQDAEDLLALTISNMQADYDANETAWEVLSASVLVTSDSVLLVTNDTLDYFRAPLVIDLHTQWNTIAYSLHHESPIVSQFENQFGSDIDANINIVKNNEGLFYWPEFNFDGIGMMVPGQGYQVRVKDSSEGKSDFIFDHDVTAEDYRTLIPTVPAWAIEMDVQNHPNDVRTLVRVVNMLGQEVNPTNQFNGEVLLYMYNDGTVEKKMVE